MPFKEENLSLISDVAKANEIITGGKEDPRRFSGTPPNTTRKDACYRLAGQFLRSLPKPTHLAMAGLPAGRMAENVAQVLDGYGFVSDFIETAEYVGFETDQKVFDDLAPLYKQLNLGFEVSFHRGNIVEKLAESAFKRHGFNVLDFDLMENLWSESGRKNLPKIVAATKNCTDPETCAFVLINDTHRGSCGAPKNRWAELGVLFDRAWESEEFQIIDSGSENYNGGHGGNTRWWFWLKTPKDRPPLSVKPVSKPIIRSHEVITLDTWLKEKRKGEKFSDGKVQGPPIPVDPNTPTGSRFQVVPLTLPKPQEQK